MKKFEQGMMLIEALVGILIFSIGVLALIALQGVSLNATTDAKYRIEAVNLANQMMGSIWTSVNRANEATVQASLLTFQHQEDGASASCEFEGTASAHAAVTSWKTAVTATLPQSDAARQQIDVNLGAGNQVTITICWKAPSDAADAPYRRHVVVANVH